VNAGQSRDAFADQFEHSANLNLALEQTKLESGTLGTQGPIAKGFNAAFSLSISCFLKSKFCAKRMKIKIYFPPKGAKTRICRIFGCETVKL
jgi:hypothetical protein